MSKAKTHGDQAEKTQTSVQTVQKGDIVRLEYDGWALEAENERLFDTTVKETAEKDGLYDEKVPYKPIPLIVGEGRVYKGLDSALVGSKVGEEKVITISPAEGAGERDPKNFTVRPLREFLRKEVEPELGKRVVVGDKVGYVVAVTSGRVRVDFNDRLAGRKLKYRYVVKEKIEGLEAKVAAIIDMNYSTSEGFKVTSKDDGAEIVLADICKYDERWFVSKYKIVSDLREVLGLKSIRFVEEYVKKEQAKVGDEVKTEEAPAPEELPK
jgi:FKBP-type peptidyl-prolyl cis-trans isomerase SlyD